MLLIASCAGKLITNQARRVNYKMESREGEIHVTGPL
jgi:hypothetical protein